MGSDTKLPGKRKVYQLTAVGGCLARRDCDGILCVAGMEALQEYSGKNT